VDMRKVVDYPELYVVVDSRSSKSHGCSKSNRVCGNLPMVVVLRHGEGSFVEIVGGD
jgi:hypothetical protein